MVQKIKTQRQRWLLGGVILALVLGLGAGVRFFMFSNLPLHSEGTVEDHYSRGPTGAAVVIKEFSDYT